MQIGVNANHEIIAVNDIPEELTTIVVNDDTFIDKDPTQYKIFIGDNWQEITPRYPTQGL